MDEALQAAGFTPSGGMERPDADPRLVRRLV
jgi:hypothetical protein